MKKTTRHQHSKGFPQWRRLRYRPVQDNHGYWTQTCRFCHIVEWVLNNNEVNNIRAMICLFREDTWINDYRRSEQLRGKTMRAMTCSKRMIEMQSAYKGKDWNTTFDWASTACRTHPRDERGRRGQLTHKAPPPASRTGQNDNNE